MAPEGIFYSLDLLLLVAQQKKLLKFINPSRNFYLNVTFTGVLVLVLVTEHFTQIFNLHSKSLRK